MSSSSSSRVAANPLDTLVYDCMVSASEAILRERRAHLRPITSQQHLTNPNADIMDYIRHVLNPWKTNMSTALTLDIYIHVPKTHEHLLLERWSFSYLTMTSELKGDNRPFAFINRRIQTLLRSLYCFVRMLPGFNMLHSCALKPLLSYQLYAEQKPLPSQFKHDVSRYQFAKISTSRGLISIGVTFLNSVPVKAIIKSISSAATNVPSSSGNTSTQGSTPQPIRRDSLGSASASMPIPISPSSYDANVGIGMSRGRTSSSDAREMHRRSFQLPVDGSAPQARSFEGRGNIIESSPFRPNDGSHLYPQPHQGNRSSPVAAPGTSPGYFSGGIPIPMLGSTPNTQQFVAKSSGTTPAGSYSSVPFAFQQMLEERNSDTSTKDLLPVGSSPPFPPFSTSLTSTSPQIMGPMYGTSLSERRLSFRKSTMPEGVSSSIGTTSGLSAAMAAVNSNNESTHTTNTMLTPSQIAVPEWQFMRQRLQIPSFPIKSITYADAHSESSSSKYLDGVVGSDKEKRHDSFDIRGYGDSTIAGTRSSSGNTRDDFFEKLKDDARASFFGDDDDELPFVVHQSELTGTLVAPRFAGSIETPKEIEIILSDCRQQLANFKQFVATSTYGMNKSEDVNI